MSKKQAPYRHQDGSNCWTKNCSRQITVKTASAALDTAFKTHMANAAPWLMKINDEGTWDAPMPPHVAETHEALKKAQLVFDEAVAQENKNRLAKQAQQNILERDDPEFLKTLERKGY